MTEYSNIRLMITLVADTLQDPLCFQTFSGKSTTELILEALKDNKGYEILLRKVTLASLNNETFAEESHTMLQAMASQLQKKAARAASEIF